MIKRRTLLAASAALGLVMGGAAFAQDVPKIGFVYVGPVNDGGWSQHHHESAMQMKELADWPLDNFAQLGMWYGSCGRTANLLPQATRTGCGARASAQMTEQCMSTKSYRRLWTWLCSMISCKWST